MANGFLKLMRSDETREVMTEPDVFTLVSHIAYRAQRTNSFNRHGLAPGEALLGDYQNYGMSERRYRTAKQKLEKWGFATFRGTSKGTIAKLTDSRIYDINVELRDEQKDDQGTNARRTSDGQATTTNTNNNTKTPSGENCKNQLGNDPPKVVNLELLRKQVAKKTESLDTMLKREFPCRSERSRKSHNFCIDHMVNRALCGVPESLQHLTDASEWIHEAKAPGIRSPEAKFTSLCQERAGVLRKKDTCDPRDPTKVDAVVGRVIAGMVAAK
jgi:hypothetical protein